MGANVCSVTKQEPQITVKTLKVQAAKSGAGQVIALYRESKLKRKINKLSEHIKVGFGQQFQMDQGPSSDQFTKQGQLRENSSVQGQPVMNISQRTNEREIHQVDSDTDIHGDNSFSDGHANFNQRNFWEYDY